MLTLYIPSTLSKFNEVKVGSIVGKGKIIKGKIIATFILPNGKRYSYKAHASGDIKKIYVKKGQVVSASQAICDITYVEIVSNNKHLLNIMDRKIWDLAIAVNACFKGLLGSRGQSGQIASRTVPVKTELDVKNGVESLINEIVNAAILVGLEEGDVVVIAEKPFPVAQGRLVPFKYIYDPDPKKLSKDARKKLLVKLKSKVNTPLEMSDLILADSYLDDPKLGEMATLGAYDHNLLAYQVAQKIANKSNIHVDVVISDTDTGIDISESIIGCITLGATPVGATKGLVLYECMRAACAAEFTRGSKERVPIVICKPAFRCRKRTSIGKFRGYHGKLNFEREGKKIAFA